MAPLSLFQTNTNPKSPHIHHITIHIKSSFQTPQTLFGKEKWCISPRFWKHSSLQSYQLAPYARGYHYALLRLQLPCIPELELMSLTHVPDTQTPLSQLLIKPS